MTTAKVDSRLPYRLTPEEALEKVRFYLAEGGFSDSEVRSHEGCPAAQTSVENPVVFSGLGHGSGAHASNEYMVIHPREESKVSGLAEVELPSAGIEVGAADAGPAYSISSGAPLMV